MMILSAFDNAILGIFETFNRAIYNFMAWTYNFMMELAGIRIFSDIQLDSFLQNLYVLLGIVMLFRLAFTVIAMVVNPDGKQAQANSSVFYRIIIVLAIIVMTPIIFNFAYALQTAIISDDVISKFFQDAASNAGNGLSGSGNETNESDTIDSTAEKKAYCYYEVKDKGGCAECSDAIVLFKGEVLNEEEKKKYYDGNYDKKMISSGMKNVWDGYGLFAKSGDPINYNSDPVYKPGSNHAQDPNYTLKSIETVNGVQGVTNLSFTYSFDYMGGEDKACPPALIADSSSKYAKLKTEKDNTFSVEYNVKNEGSATNWAEERNEAALYVDKIPENEQKGYKFADLLHLSFANKMVDGKTSQIDCAGDDKNAYSVFCTELAKIKGVNDRGEAQTVEHYTDRINFVLLGDEWKKDIYDYSYIFAFALGIVGLLFLMTSCFDIALRAVKLGFFQLIAPIVAVTYVEPSSKVFMNWVKMCVSTYLDMFIRLITLQFAAMAILFIDSTVSGQFTNMSLLYIFIMLGALMFMKAAPEIIKKLTGIDMGGSMSINPLSKLSEIPIAGKAAAMAQGTLAGAWTGARTGGLAGAALGAAMGGFAGSKNVGMMGAGGKGGGGGGKGGGVGNVSDYVNQNLRGTKTADEPGLSQLLYKHIPGFGGQAKTDRLKTLKYDNADQQELVKARISATRDNHPEVNDAFSIVRQEQVKMKGVGNVKMSTVTSADIDDSMLTGFSDRYQGMNGSPVITSTSSTADKDSARDYWASKIKDYGSDLEQQTELNVAASNIDNELNRQSMYSGESKPAYDKSKSWDYKNDKPK